MKKQLAITLGTLSLLGVNITSADFGLSSTNIDLNTDRVQVLYSNDSNYIPNKGTLTIEYNPSTTELINVGNGSQFQNISLTQESGKIISSFTNGLQSNGVLFYFDLKSKNGSGVHSLKLSNLSIDNEKHDDQNSTVSLDDNKYNPSNPSTKTIIVTDGGISDAEKNFINNTPTTRPTTPTNTNHTSTRPTTPTTINNSSTSNTTTPSLTGRPGAVIVDRGTNNNVGAPTRVSSEGSNSISSVSGEGFDGIGDLSRTDTHTKKVIDKDETKTETGIVEELSFLDKILLVLKKMFFGL